MVYVGYNALWDLLQNDKTTLFLNDSLQSVLL